MTKKIVRQEFLYVGNHPELSKFADRRCVVSEVLKQSGQTMVEAVFNTGFGEEAYRVFLSNLTQE